MNHLHSFSRGVAAAVDGLHLNLRPRSLPDFPDFGPPSTLYPALELLSPGFVCTSVPPSYGVASAVDGLHLNLKPAKLGWLLDGQSAVAVGLHGHAGEEADRERGASCPDPDGLAFVFCAVRKEV